MTYVQPVIKHNPKVSRGIYVQLSLMGSAYRLGLLPMPYPVCSQSDDELLIHRCPQSSIRRELSISEYTDLSAVGAIKHLRSTIQQAYWRTVDPKKPQPPA